MQTGRAELLCRGASSRKSVRGTASRFREVCRHAGGPCLQGWAKRPSAPVAARGQRLREGLPRKQPGSRARHGAVLIAACIVLFPAAPNGALARQARSEPAAQSLEKAITGLAQARGVEILFSPALVRGRVVARPTYKGKMPDVLSRLLAGTGITFRRTSAGTYYLVEMHSRELAGARQVPAAPRDVDEVQLDPIIVTARRRAELLEDTPLAIAAFSASDLEARGARKLEDLLPFAPGVYFTQQGFLRPGRVDANVRFRGMSINIGNPQQQLATVFIDGVPVSDGIQSLSFEDAERVEVISGPQSAIFGRSTFSGAINIITRQPSEEFEWHSQAVVDTGGDADLSSSVEGGIIEGRLAGRLSGRLLRARGDYRNPLDRRERLGRQMTGSVAASARLSLGRVTASARIRYSRDEDGPPAGWALGVFEANCGPFGRGSRRTICGDLPNIRSARFGQNTGDAAEVARLLTADGSRTFLLPPRRDYGMTRVTWNAGARAAVAIPSLDVLLEASGGLNTRRRTILADSDQGPDTVTTAFYPMKSRDVSLDLRLRSQGAARFKWSVGTAFFDQRHDETVEGIYSAFVLPSSYAPACAVAPADCDQATRKQPGAGDVYLGTFPYFIGHVTTRAAFGSADLALGPDLNAALELRNEWDRVRDTTLPGRPLAQTFSTLLYRGVLSYRPFERSTLYASASNGNLPGAFNASVIGASAGSRQQLAALGVRDTLPQQTLGNLEIGFKLRTDHLALAASAYRMRWRNQRIRGTFFDTAVSRTISYLDAAGESRLHGLEIQGSWFPAEWLLVDIGGNMASARYIKRSSSVALLVLGSEDVSGNHIPGTPKYSASLSATVRGRLSEGRTWYVTGDSNYRGRVFVDEVNLTTLSPAATFNARAGIRGRKRGVEVFATNLFQSRALRSAAGQADISAYVRAFDFTNPGFITEAPPERRVGLRLTATY